MNISPELISRTASYVKGKMYGELTGHDWYHINRVRKLASIIQKKEGGDPDLIELICLLHDLGDYKQARFNEVKGRFVLRGMMDILEIDSDLQEKILKIIDEAEFVGDDTKKPKTIEGQILQDADGLDSLGAIGIARVFSTGGNINRILHDPNSKPRLKLKKVEYQFRKQEGTSLNYFYEKVIKIPNMLNTDIAKKMAKSRIKFLEVYLKEFYAEWDGER